ncbi:MAG: MATE family efflux transporter [Bacteroidales bacterium]|nr:MATE family efflux transporter [Bacteroidales bacterium]MCM1415016.1 MATE family efflux transporter [bacterium]MCM1422870.1 MATE family efflux transporter [bacterium]
MNATPDKNRFYTQIVKLVIPIVIQNLLSAAVNSADVVMLNYVGQSSISAVSLAANYASILFMIYYGLGTGAAMLSAQYWGKGDLQPIRAVLGIAMRFSLIISVCFSAFAFFAPKPMMMLFTNDAELIEIGAGYLRVMAVTYLCWGVTEVYLAILRSIGRVTVSMALNVMAFTLNILLNAVFIFGLFGAPKLGAVGVAIATALSRAIELAGCFVVSCLSRDIKLKFSYLFLHNKLLYKDFIRLSLPALANDLSWSVAFSMYSVILGHMGSDAVAANSLVVVVRNFGTVLCFGTASAGGILLGNVMGENDMERAKTYASQLMKLTIITGAIGGALILAATPFVLHFAKLEETAMHYLKYMLLINTYYVMGAAVNTTLIAGVFRAGGDSRFGLICDTIDMWCYAVPIGFLAAFLFKLPVLWVYFLLCTDEFVKWPWVIKHYRSGKWLKNITREDLFAP